MVSRRRVAANQPPINRMEKAITPAIQLATSQGKACSQKPGEAAAADRFETQQAGPDQDRGAAGLAEATEVEPTIPKVTNGAATIATSATQASA